MKQSLVEKLCCPFDKGELEIKVLVKDTEENIIDGMLTCTQCRRYYPIAYGVPIMTPDEYREPQLEAPLLDKWKNNANTKFGNNFRLLEQ